eukprot:c8303_g1_i1.p1 GENE.c8303_g1_i1~~c8303_g1_i1.p1  ORF type:complete len:107 (-),score=11.93 c8303_g1_i1:150-470(-)
MSLDALIAAVLTLENHESPITTRCFIQTLPIWICRLCIHVQSRTYYQRQRKQSPKQIQYTRQTIGIKVNRLEELKSEFRFHPSSFVTLLHHQPFPNAPAIFLPLEH